MVISYTFLTSLFVYKWLVFVAGITMQGLTWNNAYRIAMRLGARQGDAIGFACVGGILVCGILTFAGSMALCEPTATFMSANQTLMLLALPFTLTSIPQVFFLVGDLVRWRPSLGTSRAAAWRRDMDAIRGELVKLQAASPEDPKFQVLSQKYELIKQSEPKGWFRK